MPPRGKPFDARPQFIYCPWCILIDVEFRALIIHHVVSAGPGAVEPKHDVYDPPFFRASCPKAACGYIELHKLLPVSP